jgi:hypothetical protein
VWSLSPSLCSLTMLLCTFPFLTPSLHRADLVTYLGQKLSANSKIDKDDKAYVTGAMETQKIQVGEKEEHAPSHDLAFVCVYFGSATQAIPLFIPTLAWEYQPSPLCCEK